MRSPFENYASNAEDAGMQAASSKANRSSGLLNRLLGRVVPLNSGRSSSPSLGGIKTEQTKWTSLPTHLLEDIFDILLEDGKANPAARRVSKRSRWRLLVISAYLLTQPLL